MVSQPHILTNYLRFTIRALFNSKQQIGKHLMQDGGKRSKYQQITVCVCVFLCVCLSFSRFPYLSPPPSIPSLALHLLFLVFISQSLIFTPLFIRLCLQDSPIFHLWCLQRPHCPEFIQHSRVLQFVMQLLQKQ